MDRLLKLATKAAPTLTQQGIQWATSRCKLDTHKGSQMWHGTVFQFGLMISSVTHLSCTSALCYLSLLPMPCR
jgi:hypothetical protein